MQNLRWQAPAKRRVYLSLLLFFILLAIIALPYTNWGFLRDDYGFLLNAMISTTQQFFDFFRANDIVNAVYSTNLQSTQLSWLGSLYRPMQSVHLFLEVMLLGVNPYAMLIFISALHAGIAIILFNIGSYFFPTSIAFFAALFSFGLHPMIAKWIGIFTIQIYIIDTLYFLLIVWLLLRFLTTKQWWWYVLSCTAYASCLLAKETLIVLPCWALVAVAMYLTYYRNIGNFLPNCIKAFPYTIGYGIVNLGYLGLRFYLFPTLTQHGHTAMRFNDLSTFVTRQCERFFDFVTYVCNYLYVGLVPGGNRGLKLSLVVIIMSLLVYPFYARRQQHFLYFSAFSMLILTWPAIVLFYHTRYAYIGLIFLYFIVAYAATFYLQKISGLQRYGAIFYCILLIPLSWYFVTWQLAKQNVLHLVTTENRKLALTAAPLQRPICFLALPHSWFASGQAQACRALVPQFTRPCYFDGADVLFGDEEFGPIKPHEVEISGVPPHLEIMIAPEETIGLINTPAPEQNSFDSWLGHWEIAQRNAAGKPIKLSLQLCDDLQKLNPIIVTWDYQLNQFKILNEH